MAFDPPCKSSNHLAANRDSQIASPSHHPEQSVQEKPTRRFRQVLARVMAVQVISLAVLWWLQARYGR